MGDVMKSLVVYYSRSGKTEDIARIIAKKLSSEIEEIDDHKNRKGLLGFINSGNEAYLQRTIPIKKLKKDPAQYELLIVGTPIWAGNMSTPILSFFKEYKEKINKFAFFATCLGSDLNKILLYIEHIIPQKPIAVMSINYQAFKRQYHVKMVEEFINSIKEDVKGW
jgi:flavodoxin